MRRKSAGLLIAALVALAGSLAACGSSGGGGGTASSSPKVLKVWWYEGPGSAYQIAWDQAITDFKKQHPGVTVQFSLKSFNQMQQNASMILNSSDVPDVMEYNKGDATAGLLRWCGGLPLAIRIVAARLVARPARPVAALAHRLASESCRLDELSVGDLSIRAAFDPSYRMLGTRERQVLGRLALVQGAEGDVPMAALLLGRPAEEAELLLEELVHVSLLQPLGTRDGFRLHGLVRLYAAEKAGNLDPGPGARRVLAAARISRLSPAPDSNTA